MGRCLKKPSRSWPHAFVAVQKKGGDKPAEPQAPEPVALSAEVMKRIDALQKVQDERDELQKQHDAEIRAIEIKYNALYNGNYDKRSSVVTGATEAEGVAADAPSKGIPKFWLQAMQNHGEIAQFIEEADLPALEYLEDVKISFGEKLQGFTLHFHFKPNPFFDNAVLTKEYVLPGEMVGSDEDEEAEEEGENAEQDDSPLEGVKKIQGTEILWKAGKNLCVKMVNKKVKGGRGKPKKTVQRQEEVPSFFRFFDTPELKFDEDMEPEQAMELVNQIQTDINIAQAFRDQLLPEAVRWFTGEAADDEEDDEDFEDEEEEEEEEEEDDEPPARGRRGGARGGRGGKGKKPADDEDEDDEDESEIQKTLADSFNKKMNVGDKDGKDGKGDQPECKQQ